MSTSTSAGAGHPYNCELCSHGLLNPFPFYSLGCRADARGETDARLEEATAERARSLTLLQEKEPERARHTAGGARRRRVRWHGE